MEALPFVFADKATVPGFLGRDVQKEVMKHILEFKADKILLVCDDATWKFHSGYFEPLLSKTPFEPGQQMPDVEKFVLPGTDLCKSFDNLSTLIEWAFEIGSTKRSVIVAFGGGALLNVTGLFASILFRGSKLVYVPTTFLAMHDVVTSLKTSICYDGRKNNIGSFYAPLKILIDMAFCKTLPAKELFSGLGELAKNALILGSQHARGFIAAFANEQAEEAQVGTGNFKLSEKTLMTLVGLGIDAKMTQLQADPYEKTTAMIFEYGHTVAHAIEKAYGDGFIPHGIGVAYGMLSSSYAAERLGIMSPENRKEHDTVCWLLLNKWPLPEPKPTIEKVMGFAMRDSKRGITKENDDEISDVLLRKIGDCVPTATNNLSKFPCKFVYKWLYSIGFPHEGSAKPLGRNANVSVTTEECRGLLDTIRTTSPSDLVGLGYEETPARFANNVWATKKRDVPLVVKRYTEAAFMRVEAEAIGSVDVHAGEYGVGPTVVYANPQGLVMHRLDGRTLEEADMHKNDLGLLDKIASVLSTLHHLPVPAACEGPPMVWRSIDKMIETASRTSEPWLWPKDVPNIKAIAQEVRKARVALEKRDPAIVLCHGDLLPNKVFLNKEGDKVHLIDFELGGPNYRAFDLMKIFRTGETSSETSMEHFLRAYAKNMDQSEKEISQLIAETKMFEPLTWLEAACFFLALPQFTPQETARWNSLALDRWQKYEATKHLLLGNPDVKKRKAKAKAKSQNGVAKKARTNGTPTNGHASVAK